jgi:DNA-binding GntR family transcriptional regulator
MEPSEGAMVTQFQRHNLKEDVAAYIREQIFAGSLRPNMKIDQDNIAAKLGVSKLPVREALILLASDGLVENRARRGAYVAPLTPEDIYDHYHILALLVATAAERAAVRITDEDLDKLQSLLTQMEQWDTRESAAGQEELNDRFHRIINRVGGSRRLNSVLRTLAYGIPHHLYHHTRGWTVDAQEEHREILAALRDHDGPRAAKAAAAHLDSGAADAVRRLRESGFWDDSGSEEE